MKILISALSKALKKTVNQSFALWGRTFSRYIKLSLAFPSFLRIWSYLLKKSLLENFFCVKCTKQISNIFTNSNTRIVVFPIALLSAVSKILKKHQIQQNLYWSVMLKKFYKKLYKFLHYEQKLAQNHQSEHYPVDTQPKLNFQRTFT